MESNLGRGERKSKEKKKEREIKTGGNGRDQSRGGKGREWGGELGTKFYGQKRNRYFAKAPGKNVIKKCRSLWILITWFTSFPRVHLSNS